MTWLRVFVLASLFWVSSSLSQPNPEALIAEGIEKARTTALALEPVEQTGEYRLVRHALGEAKVPLSPQRIVTLEPSLSDALIALGFNVVATVTWPPDNGPHAYLRSYLPEDVLEVGTEDQPNLEAVAAADPDLILTWNWYPDPVDELSQIAPTIAVPYSEYEKRVGVTYSNEQYLTWLVRELAAVLGAEDKVEAALQPFRDKVAEARAILEKRLEGKTVAFLDLRVDNILISGYGFDGISALIYGDLRVPMDPLVAEREVWADLSLETLPEIGSEIILTFADGDEATERLASFAGNPLWTNLPAVKAGQVIVVPSSLYYRGDDGPLGAVQVIDDLLNRLPGGE
jgi:iron complex transport system substrate-binding protein